MAHFEATIDIVGSGSVPLVVDWDSPGPVRLDGLNQREVGFTVRNPLEVQATISSIGVNVTGPSASKISASLTSDSMVVPAQGAHSNRLIISPNEELLENESVTVRISGVAS